MSAVQTFLIEDPRISKSANNTVIVGVKSGPASCVVQKYNNNSNSNSNTLFNINVPSENTLVDRHILIEGKIKLQVTVPRKAAGSGATNIMMVPASFPFNQILQSVSMNINNSKVSVQTSDVLNVILKQFDQRYLSKHCQGAANFVDKYYSDYRAGYVDAGGAVGSSSPFAGAAFAEKDSDTSGRGSATMTITDSTNTVHYSGDTITVVEQAAAVQGAAPANGLVEVFDIEISFIEPIFGLPSAALQENEGCYTGLNSLELSFQYNSLFKNVISIMQLGAADVPGLNAGIIVAPPPTGQQLLSDDSRVVLRYYSLHPSQYAKLSKKSVIPFDEMVPYKNTKDVPATTINEVPDVFHSNTISLRQIPDKLYIIIRPLLAKKNVLRSNQMVFPITGINLTFNNVTGLLSDMSFKDLYLMSRRNGSQQTFEEFSGKIGAKGGIGSYVVIDVTRDLGLDDMLSASSLGQFSLQAQITYKSFVGRDVAVDNQAELCIFASYSGILLTEQGSASLMSGLLTKQAVLDAKSKGSSNIDYDDVQKVSGGNLFKAGKSEVGRLLKSERGRIARAVDGQVDNGIDAGASRLKVMAHDKLAKYY